MYTWPIPSKGLSTVFAPIHVRIRIVDTSVQNIIFFEGTNFVLFFFFVTRIERIITEAAKATTPPSFEGIDRRTT